MRGGVLAAISWGLNSVADALIILYVAAAIDVEETREHTDDEYSIRSKEQIVRHLTYRLRHYLTASLKGTIATILPS